MRSLVVRSLVAALVSCLLGASVGQTQQTNCSAYYGNFGRPYDVATDPSGNLYVADQAQGVFKLGSSGTGAKQATYASIPLNSPDGLCLDSSNNVYVVDSGNARVIKYNNDGSNGQIIISNLTSTPALSYPWNCAVDASGYIYVPNTSGTPQGISVFAANGTQVRFLTSANPTFGYPNQVTLDSAGNIYAADSNNFHVIKFSALTNGGAGGGVQSTTFFNLNSGSYPNGVAVDSAGNVYVTDTSNGAVVVFNAAGNNLYNLTTSGPPLRSPRGVWVDSSNNVFVADSSNQRIVKFSTSGGLNNCALASTTLSVSGYNVVSVYTSGSNLNSPWDVALDSSANMYIADSGNNRVVKVAAGTSGNILQTYTTTGPALAGPNGVCLDSSNNVYVVDTNNQRVVKFTNAGVAGTVFPAAGTTLTPALQYPWNCVVDPLGRLFVSNVVGQVINVISADGTQQLAAYSVAALFPNQIAIDTAGYMYIADSNDFRISKVNPTAAVNGSSLQVLPVLQNFTLPANSFPNGVAVDTSFNVYASDTNQNYLVVWSAGGTQLAQIALPASTVTLSSPRGLAVDPSGNIYVADQGNNRVVMFQKTGSNGASSVLQSASLAVVVLTALLSLALSL